MLYTVEKKFAEHLEETVKKYLIFIDTCSLMNENADQFWGNIIPLLLRENKQIIVPLQVCREVEKHAKAPEHVDPRRSQLACKALSTIDRLQKANLITIYGDDNDRLFADNVFQTVFTRFRLRYDLLLITQDHNLAADIMNIRSSKAVNGVRSIRVERITENGCLGIFGRPKRRETPVSKSETAAVRRPAAVPPDDCFRLADKVKSCACNRTVSSVPAEGATVIALHDSSRKNIQLCRKITAGGEGTIYQTNIPGMVAKIYKKEKLNRTRHEKLCLLARKNLSCDGVCFPLALLYDKEYNFVGYLMRQAHGRELQKCVFQPQLLKKYFPSWTKQDTVTLCITILKKLKYLHDRNVILGDINPNNILVVSPTEVYFVDTDSYQIEGFPCPVGTINFTAPEIQRKDFSTFLRTIGNERFAVATLLFMIMLPGKPPYSLQGGENQVENILNGDFAYASGERCSGKAPEGMWCFCWSHLPRYLKNDFYETFRKGGLHSTEQTRFSTDVWLRKFEYYLDLLQSGKLCEHDSMSMELFPTRLKKNPHVAYIKCRICGNEVPADKAMEGICGDCLNKGETYHCAECGQEMVYKNYHKYIKKAPRRTVCPDCYHKKNAVYTTLLCADCGKPFSITYGEKESYDKKDFQLPRRCKVCRTRRSGSIFSDIPYQMPREEKPQTDEPIKSDRSSFLSALEKWFRM